MKRSSLRVLVVALLATGGGAFAACSTSDSTPPPSGVPPFTRVKIQPWHTMIATADSSYISG